MSDFIENVIEGFAAGLNAVGQEIANPADALAAQIKMLDAAGFTAFADKYRAKQGDMAAGRCEPFRVDFT